MTEQAESPQRPLLRVVRGTPDDAELAALAAVVAGFAAAAPAPRPEPRRSAWADRAALVRQMPRPGVGAWRNSALPR